MINNNYSQRIANPPSSNFDKIAQALTAEFHFISSCFNHGLDEGSKSHWMARFYIDLTPGTIIDLLDTPKKAPSVVIHNKIWKTSVAETTIAYIKSILDEAEAKYQIKKGVRFGD